MDEGKLGWVQGNWQMSCVSNEYQCEIGLMLVRNM
jgi:hypothetical protein